MSFVADENRDRKTWDYITRDIGLDRSVMVSRWFYLLPIAGKYGDAFKVAFRDPETGAWSKWEPFPSMLFHPAAEEKGRIMERAHLLPAIDVHRSVLENEIIIESDYQSYAENLEASKIIGAIIEKKGFMPHYYFSGNKSIHIHIFLDWEHFKSRRVELQEKLSRRFNGSEVRFRLAFIGWLRAKMISCWDTDVRKFDTDLIRASHLIRCELSKNKLGYKTFLGYQHEVLPDAPVFCNEDNGIPPKIGEMMLSKPPGSQELMDEFMSHFIILEAKRRISGTNRRLSAWMPGKGEVPRECVKVIMSDAFRATGDGKNRGMFILVNELKRIYGIEEARILLNDWNTRLGNAIPFNEIEYRLNRKDFSLSCEFIHSFLEELGITLSKKCNGKVYK